MSEQIVPRACEIAGPDDHFGPHPMAPAKRQRNPNRLPRGGGECPKAGLQARTISLTLRVVVAGRLPTMASSGPHGRIRAQDASDRKGESFPALLGRGGAAACRDASTAPGGLHESF